MNAASVFFDENQKLLGRLGWKPNEKPWFLAMYKDASPETLRDLKKLCSDGIAAANGNEAAQARVQMGSSATAPEAHKPVAINPKKSHLHRMDL
jgi:hypothetical protein